MRTTQLKTKQNKTVFQKNQGCLSSWGVTIVSGGSRITQTGNVKPKAGDTNLLLCHIFPKKCMEMKKKIGSGSACPCARSPTPPDSPMVHINAIPEFDTLGHSGNFMC